MLEGKRTPSNMVAKTNKITTSVKNQSAVKYLP